MKTLNPLALLLILAGALSAAEAPRFGDATPLEWSRRLADSEMTRYGNRLERNATARSRWDYTPSVLALGLWRLGGVVDDPAYRAFAGRAVGSYVQPDGAIDGYVLEDYNIDQINPGKVVLELYATTGEERFARAAHRLREQMATHPRTSEGGFWHKKRYPHQIWLDGLYMASPFLGRYALLFKEPAIFDDVANQILLIDRKTYDPATGLHYHAWDEARAQDWADKATGRSPHFWSRAIGWYAMAIVDDLELMPVSQPEIDQIVDVLRRVADGIARWQDPETGLWWQMTALGDRAGNYLEGSASAMFVYALAKGVNRGYLPREKYLPVIERGYAGLINHLVTTDAAGLVSLNQICEGAGLGYTMADGRPRDGTFEYYISEPVVPNDAKGTGPFVMAGIEVERLLSTAATDVPLLVHGWEDLSTVLSRIVAPTFPDRDFPITDFGAVSGADGDASAAIRAAIQACHTAGGGRVVVPPGDWRTGAIHLLSNVNLHVSAGAQLKFSTNPADYPIVYTRWEGMECMNYSALIYAHGAENIAVTGGGTLDGQADWDNWWAWNHKAAGQPTKQVAARQRLYELAEAGVPVAERVFGDGSFLRPNFIQTYHCKNILIEGVKIIRSPMWELHPVLSQNITVRGVEIVSHGPNNDGCDPESSRDILIEDCIFDTGDDCIAIKSGRNNDGRRVGVASENIVIRRCVMRDGHGGVVIGSEISGGCRNVFVEDCEMDSPNLDRALRFKSNARRGGVIENVFMRNVRIGQVAEAVLTIDLQYEEGADGDFPPTVRRVRLSNITSTASPRVMFIAGFEGATIDDIEIADSTFAGLTATERVEHAGRIVWRNVNVAPARAVRSLNSNQGLPHP